MVIWQSNEIKMFIWFITKLLLRLKKRNSNKIKWLNIGICRCPEPGPNC